MKVRTLIRFQDSQSNTLRMTGEIFEATPKRLEQINSSQHGELVEAIEENKKEVKPKAAKK